MSVLDHSLPEHFGDREQLERTNLLGMWLFLTSEILLFGGAFLAYAVLRVGHPEGFAEASHELDIPLGTINTAILLLSSWAVARAELAAESDDRALARRLLAGAALVGVCFLGIKAWEYGVKFHHGHVPGADFPAAEFSHPGGAQLYFFLYYAMTGLHALHLVIGIGLLLYTRWALGADRKRRRLSAGFLSGTALYWHLVDLIWIFLYPLFYLIA